MVMDTMGMKAGWMAQQAMCATTQNESEQRRWLQRRQVNTDGAIRRWHMYLGIPHRPASILGIPHMIWTCRVVEASSRWALQISATPDHVNALTKLHGHVATILDDIYTLYVSYKHQQRAKDRLLTCAWCCTKPRIQDCEHWRSVDTTEPRLTILGNHTSAVWRDDTWTTYRLIKYTHIHLLIGIHFFQLFILLPHLFRQALHSLRLSCLRGSVGIYSLFHI